jgi:predicted Zn-dependent protease with MMP-like domain
VTAEVAWPALRCRASTLRSLCESVAVSDLRRARFARLVAKAVRDLPEVYREKMRNVEIVIEDAADPSHVPDGKDLLGLYEGVPLTERRDEPFVPDRISIFRKPIEAMTSSPRVQAKIVRDTVIHEIAHHFGISDERLDQLGRG